MKRSTRQIRLAQLPLLMLVAGVLIFLFAHRATADTNQGFVTAPSQTTVVPWASSNNVAIQASDCGSAESCIATGYYADAANQYAPLVMPIMDGAPSAGSEVTLPAGADPVGHQASLDGVSCWDPGSCTAVGDYFDSSSHSLALAVPIGDNQPGAGAAVPLPGNANASPASQLASVNCASGGSCLAAGSYLDSSGNTDALVVPIDGATVETGIQVAAPAGSEPSGSQDAQLNDVTCWSAAGCVAVGSFKDTNGDFQALVVPITNGVPGAAVAVAPPADAATAGSSTVPAASLLKVSCWSAGSCVAVGSYATAANNVEGLVVPITDGVPGTAAAAALPADAATADSTQNAALTDVSCTDDGQCAAVGDYLASSIVQEPLVEQITNGEPSDGQNIWLPAGAGLNRQDATLASVSCPSSGTCDAVGSYTDGYGDVQELTVPISEGVGGAGSTPPPLPNESSFYPYTQLTAVSCSASGSCVALGTYANTSGVQVPSVYSMQAPLSINTERLPQARKGSSYDAPLSVAGAWGSYNWAVSSGSLPQGLSLNAQTGEISGTPLGTGTATFTVSVSGTGVPAQTASQQLTITVANAWRPHVSVAHGSLPVTANRVQLELGCAGSTCRGTARFHATQVVSVRVKVKYSARVRYKVRVRVRVKVKPKPAVTTTTPTGTTTTPAPKPKPRYRYKVKWRTKRVTKYRTESVHQNRTVVIGQANYSLAPGATDTLTVALNRMGNNLLSKAKGHRLSTSLTVVTSGGNHVERSPLTIMRKAASQHKG